MFLPYCERELQALHHFRKHGYPYAEYPHQLDAGGNAFGWEYDPDGLYMQFDVVPEQFTPNFISYNDLETLLLEWEAFLEDPTHKDRIVDIVVREVPLKKHL